MAYPIAKRITLNLIAEIIVALVTVMLAIGWMASKQNQQAEATTHTMVVGGIEAMEETVKSPETPICKVNSLGTATTKMPARRAASTPLIESSKTTASLLWISSNSRDFK